MSLGLSKFFITELLNKKSKKDIIFWMSINFFFTSINLFSYALLVPFFSSLVNQNILTDIFFTKYLLKEFNLDNLELITIIGITTLLLIIFSNLLLIYNEKIKFKIIRNVAVIITNKYINLFLNADYLKLTKYDKTSIISRLLVELESLVTSILVSSFEMLSRLLILLLITTALLIFNFYLTVFGAITLMILFISINKFFHKKLLSAGRLQVNMNTLRSNHMDNFLKNFITLKLYNYTEIYIKKLTTSTSDYYDYILKSRVYKKIPSSALEIFFFLILIFTTLLYINFTKFNLSFFLITISAYALASYKLMPSLQHIFFLYSEIKNNYPKLEKLMNDFYFLKKISKKNIKYTSPIRHKINNNKNLFLCFDNVSLKIDKKYILKKINFNIHENTKVCLWGASGSGKTTIINLILGLIKPTYGHVILGNELAYNLNQKEISAKFSYVPSALNLLNENIKKNITLNKNLKLDTLKKITKIFNLNKIINNKSINIHENVSTGEIKRILLARSVYHESECLILDEPTSNLDFKNKSKVINFIKNFKKTIIFSSHDKKLRSVADIVINT